MHKRILGISAVITLAFASVACGKETEVDVIETLEAENEIAIVEEENPEADANDPESDVEEASIGLEDGIYLANFDTDSSMFHVNETCDGKGILTVKDGKATIHIALVSKNIVNLYLGTVDTLDESQLLEPTVEEITYPDGLTEEVNAFDVPVPWLDEEFDLALLGKKGIWYDHKVSVSNPQPYEATTEETTSEEQEDVSEAETVLVTLTGGSGKSTIDSPAKMVQNDAGQYVVTIVWSSPHYDYMIVDGEKIFPINTEGNSTFEITISEIPCVVDVIADTVAMSTPHEIEYTIGFEYMFEAE
ncbi:MAG: iron transporter [Lachnospiraceae bacterium]|nr:iron transporter [Lachnospiraceae bacterium]